MGKPPLRRLEKGRHQGMFGTLQTRFGELWVGQGELEEITDQGGSEGSRDTPHIPIFEHSLGKGLLPGKHWATLVSLVDTIEQRVDRSDLDQLLVQEVEGENM